MVSAFYSVSSTGAGGSPSTMVGGSRTTSGAKSMTIEARSAEAMTDRELRELAVRCFDQVSIAIDNARAKYHDGLGIALWMLDRDTEIESGT